jgi:hypothetical protein
MSDEPNRPGTMYPAGTVSTIPTEATMPAGTSVPYAEGGGSPAPTTAHAVTTPETIPAGPRTLPGTPAVLPVGTGSPPGTVEPVYPTTSVTGGSVPAAGLGVVGLLTLLLGAWAGIAVFVGPTFGWSPDGGTAWHWDLVRGVLHAAPGGAGVLAGVLMMARTPRAARGAGRSEAAVAGLLAVVAGAWLVIGPSLWPVIRASSGPLFATGSALRIFTYQVGPNFGPGLLLAVTGACAIAWSVRRARTRAVTTTY